MKIKEVSIQKIDNKGRLTIPKEIRNQQHRRIKIMQVLQDYKKGKLKKGDIILTLANG